MARQPRKELAGGVHHVWARGNNRQRIYFDRVDYERYEHALAAAIGRFRWRCLAFCLMPNHLHLVLETPEPNLGRGMQRVQSEYARRFNERYARCGHVFQGRYGSDLIGDDDRLALLVGYVAANPVRAGLTERPEDWPWSSHARVASDARPAWVDHERLLWRFGAWGGDPLRGYSEAVAARLAAGPPS